ncbi:hypothetical protein ACQJBY_030416 [Aegilops geniculata]
MDLAGSSRCKMDWAALGDGPAGLIAERVLAYDVADFLRFRAVCSPWRRCSVNPSAHDVLDRRFHPRRWTMLREELAAPERRCFLNTSTGECVQVDIPDLHDHKLLAVTPEGLLLLVHQRNHVRLLNPLTRKLTELPPLTTLLPSKFKNMGILDESNELFDTEFIAWGSGVASDGSTFVLCFNMLDLLATAKPGDDHWTSVKNNGDGALAALMFEGRFYCVDNNGVMVLKTGADQAPRLEVAAKMDSIYAKMENMDDSQSEDSFHLVDNCGELMLVHRWGGLTAENKSCCLYDPYRVDLDNGTLFPVKSFGGSAGRAVFIGMHSSLSVSLDVFPSGSLIADTIYLSFDDDDEREWLEVGAYHLTDGSVQRPCTYSSGLVPRPHTLVDCLSLSNTVRGLTPFP